MQKLSFVIGPNATGKSYFIKNHFADRDNIKRLDIFEYQDKAYAEAGYKDKIPLGAEFRCLLRANELHIHDIIEELKNGHDVVAEQTFLKAKRRISYIEAIRKEVDVEIEVFVMCPSDEQWAENVEARGKGEKLEHLKKQASDVFDFPNPAEGFDAIYEVKNGEILLRMDAPDYELVETAKKELNEELQQISKEDDEKRKRQELLESMKTRPFWHYCEVCGKKEFITAKAAFDNGWDYPPNIGVFGLLGPRTCGKCQLKDTLYFKVHYDKERFPIPLVLNSILTPEELVTWNRIKAEPDSLLEKE